MSSEQYQRNVNSLDKDIADLEKKKAAADKKAADKQGKAARVRFSGNDSMSSLKMKMNEKERHEKAARKASEESANLQKKIVMATLWTSIIVQLDLTSSMKRSFIKVSIIMIIAVAVLEYLARLQAINS